MYMTGQIKFTVDFEHIISHDVSLASDMLVAFSRFQHKMKVVVSKYVSDMKRKLDDIFNGSMPHLSSQSLCGEVAVFVVHMPESMESFSEFIKLPGNEIILDQTIFQGPNSVVIQKKTDIGLLALCSYLQQMCQKHADGDSWDGQLSLEDFKVFNKKVFKICRRSCGFSTHLSTSRDYERFAMDFLKLYGNSAFIKVLINDMKTYIRVEEYNDAAAREFRFRMMTHFAGKSSVLIALIFVEFFRAIRLLKHNGRCSVALVLKRRLVAWIRKAKGNPVLLNVYNHKKNETVILENLECLEKSLPAGSDKELEVVVNRLRSLVTTEKIDSQVLLESHSQPDAAIDDEKPSEVVVFYDERSISQPGDQFYKASLLSLVSYVRHGVTHIGDLDNAGKLTWIKKLIELELLLSHVLDEEMSHLPSDLVLNIDMLSDEALEMLEDSWNVFARLITNIPYSEPLGLRELRALKSRKN
ncbi:hypothetical protein ACQ4PT_006005 [Festuca glaucescens]